MAKQYSARLTLQDNWNQVIDRAITKTSRLLREAQKLERLRVNPEVNIRVNQALMRRVQNDLNRLRQSTVNINARLDSSFRSTVNAIQRAVPNRRVVSITARETVTSTLNNIERQVFTRTNKINNVLRGSMRAIGSTINASLSPLSRLVNGLGRVRTAISAARALASRVGGAGLLGSALAGRVAGRVASRAVRQNSGIGDMLRQRGILLEQDMRYDAILTKLERIASRTKGVFGKAFQDVVKKARNQFEGIITNSDIAEEFNRFFGAGLRGIWDIDSNFGRMIVQQKAKLRQLGDSNPLSQYRRMILPTSDDPEASDEVYGRMPSKMSAAIARVRNTFKALWIEVRNGASTASNAITNFFNKAFNKIKASSLYPKITAVFNKISNYVQRTTLKMVFAFQRGIYHISARISTLIVTALRVTSSVATFFNRLGSRLPAPITRAMGKIGSSIKKIAGKTFKFTIMAIDKASSIVKGIASKAASLAKTGMGALIAGATAGATVGITGMAEREKNLVSIEHFMDVADKKNNNGKNSMTREQLNKNANDYMKDLIHLANTTPFDSQDVSSAGTRAIQMANGDVSKGMEITTLAADMAALSPGKTVQDAMEALYDVGMSGETERLKEFGLKVSQAELKALVGKGETDDLNQEELMKAFQKLMDGPLKKTFSGGAEELSQTVAGKFATATDSLQSGLTEVAIKFAPQMAAALDFITEKLDNLFAMDENGNFTNSFIIGFIDGINMAISFVGKLVESFKTLMPKVSNALAPIKNALKKVFGDISLGDIFNKVVEILGKVVQFAKPFLDVFAGMFERLAPKVMPVIDKIIDAFVSISPAFAAVVDMITPVLEFFIDAFGKLADFIIEKSDSINMIIQGVRDIWDAAWSIISEALETAWIIIEPILGWLLEKLGNVIGKLGEAMQAVKEWDVGGKINHVLSPSEWKLFGGDGYTNDKKADGSHATGLQYVPDNGYRAILHRGEAVLTRQEADRYRAGQSNNNRSMNVTINVTGSDNPERVAQVVYNKLMETANNMV